MKLNPSYWISKLKTNSRSAKAGRQVAYSSIFQGINILIGFLYVPLLLNYLTQEKYGIWLTLTSILGWFGFFDIGLGNGLRNKLGEALASGNYELGQKYVSTTYALLSIIFGFILCLFHIFNHFFNWNSILNTKSISGEELFLLTSIVFSFFLIRFIVQLISVIYLADQKSSISNFVGALGNILSIILVSILTISPIKENLVLLGSIISVIPVIIFIVISIISFGGKYKFLKPSVKKIDFTLSKDLMNLGFKFFFLQISFIIIFSTSSFFITQFYGPEEVVNYNIVFKYFQIPIMVFSIILSPIWSAVTNAYANSDYDWLKKTLKRLNILSVVFTMGILLMVVLSKWFFSIWVGDNIDIPYSLLLLMALYAIMQVFIAPYSSFINGLGKIKLTMLFTFLGIAVYLILIFAFKSLFNDSSGIILAIICTTIIGGIIQPLQVYKILSNKSDNKIWNK